MKRKLFKVVMTTVLSLSLCVIVLAAGAIQVQAAGGLFHTVSMEQEGSGRLYWNYGKNMEFFLLDGENYNENCRIKKGESYRFSSLTDRGFIAEPEEGWYFDGVFDGSGRRLPLETVNIDVIRVKVKGIYFYDYIPSYDNPQYRRLTEKAYKELMKTSLKALYGTRVYKVMDRTVLYRLPEKDGTYYPVFRKMKAAPFPGSVNLVKKLDSPDFYAAGQKDFEAKYSSSSSKIIKIDKKTGLCSVKGPGIATLTVKVSATEKTLGAVHRVTVTVMPEAVSGLSAARAADKKSVTVKWKGDSRYSGYEVQISSGKGFSAITAKKNAASGKTNSTKVSTAKSAVCRYVRVRPYKTSKGQKLYGPYVSAKVAV